MKLLTKELEKKIPALYATEDIPIKDKVVTAKYFTPWGSYSFFVIEGGHEDDDYIFWGLVTGLYEDELGYSSLKEMESAVGPYGLKMERDLHFTPKPLSDIPEASAFLARIKED